MSEPVSKTVTIECPRCGGHGSRDHWHPDRGVCYRCKGRGTVDIDIERHKAALRHLRAKYRRLREAVKKTNQDENNTVVVALRYCEQDGRRVRADLEAAGVELP